MGIQVTVSANQIDKERLGYSAISLDSLIATTAVTIKAGSKVEVGGALYEFTMDETESGGTWAAATASALAWIYIVPAGASTTFIYSSTAPTYDLAKQGWYNGSNRAVVVLYKDAASLYQAKNIIPEASSAPLTIIAQISSTVDPFIFNLPASNGGGMRVRVIDYATASTNLVKIHPASTDNIGSAGNVDCYLQNIDQSGVVYKHQFLDLVDSASGTWTVVGGQFCPHQTAERDGEQYHLGKLHHMPQGNTVSRTISSSITTPASAAYSAAQTAWGVGGVPSGAKGIRAKVLLRTQSDAAGVVFQHVCFSDNNSNTPALAGSQASVIVSFVATAAPQAIEMIFEIDIPVNSSGQFYCYDLTIVNTTAANDQFTVVPVGFYMGD